VDLRSCPKTKKRKSGAKKGKRLGDEELADPSE
jgi:hypothetical protein